MVGVGMILFGIMLARDDGSYKVILQQGASTRWNSGTPCSWLHRTIIRTHPVRLHPHGSGVHSRKRWKHYGENQFNVKYACQEIRECLNKIIPSGCHSGVVAGQVLLMGKQFHTSKELDHNWPQSRSRKAKSCTRPRRLSG